MPPVVMSIIAPVLSVIGLAVSGYLVLRKDKYGKQVDAQLATASQQAIERQENYTNLQADLSQSREEARKLRTELQAGRDEADDLWKQLRDVRAEMSRQMEEVKSEGERRIRQMNSDHARELLKYTRYVDLLKAHIVAQKPPPAPDMPEE